MKNSRDRINDWARLIADDLISTYKTYTATGTPHNLAIECALQGSVAGPEAIRLFKAGIPKTPRCGCGELHAEPVDGFGSLCPACVEYARDEADFADANAADVDGSIHRQV